MKYIATILIVLCSILSFSQKGKVSGNTGIKKGKLKNGLTYYIYNNEYASRDRASFYLIQNVGAILEDDSQNGLAHFLEHMCFKGTKHYPKNAILSKFEAKGLKSVINAYTGVESTVYHMDDLPVRDAALCDEALVILHDWCNELLLEQDQIDSERHVIVEEIRTRRTLSLRIAEKLYPYLFNKTMYGERFVCGTPEIIKNFKRDNLERLYKTWYRTDLQAVVVIGNIDVGDVERKIKNLFGAIPEVDNPKARPFIDIPDNKEDYFVKVTDKEVVHNSIQIHNRIKVHHTFEDFYKRTILNELLYNRNQELAKQDTANMFSCRLTLMPKSDHYHMFETIVEYKVGKEKEALEALVGMKKDILINGFTQEELDKVLEPLKERMKMYKERWLGMPNKAMFEMVKNNYIFNRDILSGQEQYTAFNKLIRKFTLNEIKLLFKQWCESKNTTTALIAKNIDDIKVSRDFIDKVIKEAKPRKVIPRKENKVSDDESLKFVDRELDSKDIKSSEVLDILNADCFTLSNGAKVIYKENKGMSDAIIVKAFSEGGQSVYSGDKLLNSSVINHLGTTFGAGNYTRKQLDDVFNELGMGYNLQVNEFDEEINAWCKYEDAERTFEMIYSIFESPVFYREEFDKIITKVKESYYNSPNDYNSRLKDTISYYKQGSKRFFKLNEEYLKKINFETIKKVYRERFSDASNFTFYIVGNIGRGNVKKLCKKYIANISSTNTNEQHVVISNSLPRGYNRLELKYDMVDAKAGNHYIINSVADSSFTTELAYEWIGRYIFEKTNRVLRYAMNGTYGVQIDPYYRIKGTNVWGYDLQYDCDPQKLDTLNIALNATIAFIAKHGMLKEDLMLYKKPYKGLEDVTKDMLQGSPPPNDNQKIINILKEFVETGMDFSNPLYLKEAVEKIDITYINNLIKRFFGTARILDVKFRPTE